MSPNPYPLFSVSESDNPEHIKMKIRKLTRLYIKDPCPFIAEAVAKHVRAILVYPNYIDSTEQLCRLRRLEMHWRCIAWNDSSSQKP